MFVSALSDAPDFSGSVLPGNDTDVSGSVLFYNSEVVSCSGLFLPAQADNIINDEINITAILFLNLISYHHLILYNRNAAQ